MLGDDDDNDDTPVLVFL